MFNAKGCFLRLNMFPLSDWFSSTMCSLPFDFNEYGQNIYLFKNIRWFSRNIVISGKVNVFKTFVLKFFLFNDNVWYLWISWLFWCKIWMKINHIGVYITSPSKKNFNGFFVLRCVSSFLFFWYHPREKKQKNTTSGTSTSTGKCTCRPQYAW